MPIDNIKRPDLPYDAQKLPNYNRYQLLGKNPPTAKSVDAELNSLVDKVNIVIDGVNDLEFGSIPGADDPANENKILTTNGDTLTWQFITDVNIEADAITGDSIAQNTITGGADGNIGLQAVTNANLAADIGIDKLANTANFASALVTYNAQAGVGQSRFTQYGEVLGFTAQLTSGPTATQLYIVWNSTVNNSCNGAKIANNTIAGAKIINGTIDGAKLINSAISSDQLAEGAVICSKITPRTIQADRIAISAITSTEIAVGSIVGDRIAPNAITIDKLSLSLSRLLPFSMASIIVNNTVPVIGATSYNIASVVRTYVGQYTITFLTPAANAQYVVVVTPNDLLQSIISTCSNRTANGFSIYFNSPGVGDLDASFSYLVFSF
jgi:hypothetical protein